MVHGLLASAAHRHQRAAVRSEAGIGETVLLDHLVRRAEECRGVRAAGGRSEIGPSFAVLHQLCLPLLEGVTRLPCHEEALSTAFGLTVLASLRMPWSAS
jgi:hypothetical protein